MVATAMRIDWRQRDRRPERGWKMNTPLCDDGVRNPLHTHAHTKAHPDAHKHRQTDTLVGYWCQRCYSITTDCARMVITGCNQLDSRWRWVLEVICVAGHSHTYRRTNVCSQIMVPVIRSIYFFHPLCPLNVYWFSYLLWCNDGREKCNVIAVQRTTYRCLFSH